MSFVFTSSPGNVFNRLGKLGLLVKQLASYQTSQLTNLTSTSTGAVAQYNAEPDIQAIIGAAYQSVLSSSSGGVASVVHGAAVGIVNRMVFRDNPRLGQNLNNIQELLSLQELIRQMKVQG